MKFKRLLLPTALFATLLLAACGNDEPDAMLPEEYDPGAMDMAGDPGMDPAMGATDEFGNPIDPGATDEFGNPIDAGIPTDEWDPNMEMDPETGEMIPVDGGAIDPETGEPMAPDMIDPDASDPADLLAGEDAGATDPFMDDPVAEDPAEIVPPMDEMPELDEPEDMPDDFRDVSPSGSRDPVEVTSVPNGSTFVVDDGTGPLRVRMMHVSVGEPRATDPVQGLAAYDYVVRKIFESGEGSPTKPDVTIERVGMGSDGVQVVHIYADDENLGESLLERGLAEYIKESGITSSQSEDLESAFNSAVSKNIGRHK